MEEFPYELAFLIAIHLNSPNDLSSFSQVCQLFSSVSRDDRLWKRLCYQLYNIPPMLEPKTRSYHDLFTKLLVPYGRYLGYWKSNQSYCGGLIQVELNLTDGTILGEKLDVINGSLDVNANDNDDNAWLTPIYTRTKLFTIDSTSREIFCHECNLPHRELPWRKTFNTNQSYFGLSHEALPIEERSSLISRDSVKTEEREVYFTKDCSTNLLIVYRPLSIPEPTTGDIDHPLTRLNGIWVGSYGGHGLEILHLEYCQQFPCPITADGVATEIEVVPNALIATKISGDRNVPHGQISFAAVRPSADQANAGKCYEGIGQIAQTDFVEPQFIRTKVIIASANLLKVTWFALHHTSSFRRWQL